MYLGIALVLILTSLSSKVSYRIGMPTIVFFIFFGMFLGSDIAIGFKFTDVELAKQISDIALLFIMFYGGFSLNWTKTRKIAKSAITLATFGVFLTALFIGLFTHFVFGLTLMEGLLVGAVLSPTDAASVFSVLSTSKLNLKNSLGQLLEMESGSNDPVSYTLVMLFIALALNKSVSVFEELFIGVSIGLLVGYLVGKIAIYIINKITFEIDGLYVILVIGMAMLSFGIAQELHANPFLAVFLTGIVIGNKKIVHRNSISKYFDGISWLMQIMLFVTLSLLIRPSHLPSYFFDALILGVFLIFIARPLVVFISLLFSKQTTKEKILISVAGFRGAVSLVFAAYVLVNNMEVSQWVFNVVFIIALISLMVQGFSFVPLAHKLKLVEEENNVEDFLEFTPDTVHDISKRIIVDEESNILHKMIMDLDIPEELRFVYLERNDKIIFPISGLTKFEKDDVVVLTGSIEHVKLIY